MVFGIAMVASPWLLGYAGLEGATMNAVIIGFLVFALSALALTLLDRWEAWINAALGIWLILSPWLLGFAIYDRSEEHTSELQSLMRTSYAVFCLKKKHK